MKQLHDTVQLEVLRGTLVLAIGACAVSLLWAIGQLMLSLVGRWREQSKRVPGHLRPRRSSGCYAKVRQAEHPADAAMADEQEGGADQFAPCIASPALQHTPARGWSAGAGCMPVHYNGDAPTNLITVREGAGPRNAAMAHSQHLASSPQPSWPQAAGSQQTVGGTLAPTQAAYTWHDYSSSLTLQQPTPDFQAGPQQHRCQPVVYQPTPPSLERSAFGLAVPPPGTSDPPSWDELAASVVLTAPNASCLCSPLAPPGAHAADSEADTGTPLSKGEPCLYTHSDGHTQQRVTVVGVHWDDATAPYYTIMLADGLEKSTERHRLTRISRLG